MTQPVKDLQSRLNDAADGKLKKHIEAAIEPLNRLLSYYDKVTLTAVQQPDFCKVLEAIKTAAFDKLQATWREAETLAFMNNVERLGTQIDELRNQVEG